MTLSDTAALVALIAATGIALDASEILRGRRELAQFFSWRTMARYQRGRLARLGAKWPALADRVVWTIVALHAVAAAAAAYVLAYGDAWMAAPLAGFVVAVRILLDHRFPFSIIGADHMQVVVWIALILFSLSGEIGQKAALLFIGGHGVLAYLTTGFAKLKKKPWRDGTAVSHVMQSTTFGTPRLAAALPMRVVSPAVTWATLAFEMAGPFLILLGPEGALVFCGTAVLFHSGIAVTMGLTPFLFAFASTHPAIYWLAT